MSGNLPTPENKQTDVPGGSWRVVRAPEVVPLPEVRQPDVIEALCPPFTSECQRFGPPRRLNHTRLWQGAGGARHVSCGFNHFALVSSTRQLFTWGFGGSGELGHGDGMIHVPSPRAVATMVRQLAS
jgi:alpha-tubulin suppressor-like RCC1 family protein